MSTKPELILISAMTRSRVIGKDRALPWNIPEEYEQFLGHVRGNTVLMGRTSYEIFGPDLPDSHLVVVSSVVRSAKGATVCSDIETAVERARSYGRTVFSAGGAAIYRQTMPHADAMYLSFVKGDYEGDTHFPEWSDADWRLERTEDRERDEFRVYLSNKRRRNE